MSEVNRSAPLGAVVIGAGQAGLAASFHLKAQGIRHVVLEQNRPGESWRSQRWESFVLNTPNQINDLPGLPFVPSDPNGFESPARLVEYFERYIAENQLPVQLNTRVTKVSRGAGESLITVDSDSGSWETENVIVASGFQNSPRIPRISRDVPEDILSIHSADYRHPDQLPEGATLVVGSAQTGCQIAEDLLAVGRTVFLSTSKVPRVRRRIRGTDITVWMKTVGLLDQSVADLENPALSKLPQPLATGVDGGRTISLQSVWRAGGRLLGHLDSFDGSRAIFRDDLQTNIEFGDSFSRKILDQVVAVAERVSPDSPPLEDDPADEPDADALELPKQQSIDLQKEGVRSIIWCTGFGGDCSWLDIDGALDQQGMPDHVDGVSQAPGVYFLGVPWLRNRGSGIIFGAGRDGAYVARHIAERLAS